MDTIYVHESQPAHQQLHHFSPEFDSVKDEIRDPKRCMEEPQELYGEHHASFAIDNDSIEDAWTHVFPFNSSFIRWNEWFRRMTGRKIYVGFWVFVKCCFTYLVLITLTCRSFQFSFWVRRGFVITFLTKWRRIEKWFSLVEKWLLISFLIAEPKMWSIFRF